ncbi:MAG: ScyD/ScyE family protein, partial [Vicinamibacterales bacterium]
MPQRQVVVALAIILALLLPATAMAQIGSAFGDVHSLTAPLKGDNEVPPADPDGFGYARITVFLNTGRVCFQLSVARIDLATAAHIHAAAAGVAGPVVVPLEAPNMDGMSRGCMDADAALLGQIVAEPWNYYVNVHNATYPGGAVRGQLEGQGGPAPPPPPQPVVEVIATGLDSPRGIDIGADGTVYVAQAGSGGDECVMLGEGEDAAERCFGDSSSVSMVTDSGVTDVISGLPSYMFSEGEFLGAQDVVIEEDGSIAAIVGLGMDPALREDAGELAEGLGWIVIGDGSGGWTPFLDVAAYETANNPDGGLHDSNPFQGALAAAGGGAITDAGANALLGVTSEGVISTLAVFPDTMVEAPPFLELPPGTMIPMQAVPTGLAQGPDGSWYVGQLTGFPFVPGAAKVWKVTPGEDPEVVAEGFTNIIGLDVDAAGNIWVLEIAAGGLLNVDPENPASMAGGLYKVSPDGDVE